jgi:uncharacterized membrane protein
MAVFPSPTLGVPKRLIFGLGWSLAVAVLGGIVLNWTPWGLQRSSWSVFLSGITLGASAVALVRRLRYPAVNRNPTRIGIDLPQGLLVGLAVLVVVAALAVAYLGAVLQPRVGFTQLWMLPTDETEWEAVQLGVRNMDSTTMQYSLQVEIAGDVVREWPTIELAPGGQWEAVVTLPEDQLGSSPVEAVLYRVDSPRTVYRHVTLWPGG